MEREPTNAPAGADGFWETLPRVRRPPPVLYNVNALTAVQRIATPKPKASKGKSPPTQTQRHPKRRATPCLPRLNRMRVYDRGIVHDKYGTVLIVRAASVTGAGHAHTTPTQVFGCYRWPHDP